MVALLLAAGSALVVSLLGTRFAIDWLRARGVGQFIREEGPPGHAPKAGTPTMGGVMIVISAIVGYGIAHVRSGVVFTRSGLLVMAVIAGAAAVGAADDWLGIKHARNLGLTKRTKILGLLGVAIVFVVLAVYHTPVHTELAFTRIDTIDIDLGRLGWAVLAVLLILGFSNAVNLTDGLDGLAAGSASYSFIAYTVIGFWGFRHPEVYGLAHALDVAVVSAAMLGACTGFLWWNAAPARIYMGDTGSLAIGAAVAGLAVMTDTHLLLPIVGGLFVMETMSVILQVGSYRVFNRRIFRMAPIHHHFELLGWPETTVIVRFWILAMLSTAMGLGLYYADFLTTGVPD